MILFVSEHYSQRYKDRKKIWKEIQIFSWLHNNLIVLVTRCTHAYEVRVYIHRYLKRPFCHVTLYSSPHFICQYIYLPKIFTLCICLYIYILKSLSGVIFVILGYIINVTDLYSFLQCNESSMPVGIDYMMIHFIISLA